jgi:hypothetical protein
MGRAIGRPVLRHHHARRTDATEQIQRQKGRLDGCNIAILQYPMSSLWLLASHHHRPENKAQSGNDFIYLVLAPKIIIFLITHFEKCVLLIIVSGRVPLERAHSPRSVTGTLPPTTRVAA